MKLLALPAALAVGAFLCPAQTVTVANYSGLTATAPIAPGSIASAYGAFGSVTTTSAPTLNPMPKEIAGLRVRVAGQEAPLYFVSTGQINFVVPIETASGRQAVEVVSAGNVISRGTVLVWDFGPGLAVSDPAPNRLQGIIQNQDFSINSQSARARRGQVIQIYATGCGRTSPAIQDGVPPTQLSSAIGTVEVFVANDRANLQFAGAHPQFPGVCQINAIVPDKAYLAGQTPLYFVINGLPSNQVSFWVE